MLLLIIKEVDGFQFILEGFFSRLVIIKEVDGFQVILEGFFALTIKGGDWS